MAYISTINGEVLVHYIFPVANPSNNLFINGSFAILIFIISNHLF